MAMTASMPMTSTLAIVSPLTAFSHDSHPSFGGLGGGFDIGFDLAAVRDVAQPVTNLTVLGQPPFSALIVDGDHLSWRAGHGLRHRIWRRVFRGNIGHGSH